MKRNTADKWFSLYIRKRDAIKYGDGERVPCVTCGTWGHWRYDMDCGHFITRNKWAVRYNEFNANAQCKKCNRHGHGEQDKHAQAIERRYGRGRLELLRASQNDYSKRGPLEMKAISDEYRKKFKEIE